MATGTASRVRLAETGSAVVLGGTEGWPVGQGGLRPVDHCFNCCAAELQDLWLRYASSGFVDVVDHLEEDVLQLGL